MYIISPKDYADYLLVNVLLRILWSYSLVYNLHSRTYKVLILYVRLTENGTCKWTTGRTPNAFTADVRVVTAYVISVIPRRYVEPRLIYCMVH